MLYVLKMEKNILLTTKRRKTKWIGYIWRKNCILKRIIERKMERRGKVTGRQGRSCKQPPVNLKEKR